MTNTVEESIVGFFKKFFSPLKSRFKKMDPLTQDRVALSVTLAGFICRAAEDQLLPIIVPALATSMSPSLRKCLVTELAIGLISCLSMPDEFTLNDIWGLESDALRQITAMLVFSENDDPRQVLETAKYSSNPDEARVQVLLSIVRLAGAKNDNLMAKINTPAFGKEWTGFVTEFVDGAITGLKRAQRLAVIESVADKLESLSPRSQTLIEEFIKRVSDIPKKEARRPIASPDRDKNQPVAVEKSSESTGNTRAAAPAAIDPSVLKEFELAVLRIAPFHSESHIRSCGPSLLRQFGNPYVAAMQAHTIMLKGMISHGNVSPSTLGAMLARTSETFCEFVREGKVPHEVGREYFDVVMDQSKTFLPPGISVSGGLMSFNSRMQMWKS